MDSADTPHRSAIVEISGSDAGPREALKLLHSLPAPTSALEQSMLRTVFLQVLTMAWLLVAGSACALDLPGSSVRLAWLKVPGASDPTSSLTAWAQEIRLRTSIDIASQPVGVRPEDPALFSYPFLYWGGDRAPAHLSDQAVAALRQHLSTGGMLFIDNTGRTEASEAFDQGIRHELARLFPQPLQRVTPTHVLYRSFYRLERPVGRRADAHELEGIRVGNQFAVLYGRNDLAGALARQAVGGYALAVVPGGETQREQTFRLAVNLMMYALCLDYKDDHTHVMHLLRTRRGAKTLATPATAVPTLPPPPEP